MAGFAKSIFSFALLSVSLTVPAAESFPDLRGTWVGEGKGVFVTAPGSKTNAHFSSTEITLVVEEQQDRRFSGTLAMSKDLKPIVGVITNDGNIWWSEPGGFVEGRLTDSDAFEGCYVRVSAFSQLAACEVLKRQP